MRGCLEIRKFIGVLCSALLISSCGGGGNKDAEIVASSAPDTEMLASNVDLVAAGALETMERLAQSADTTVELPATFVSGVFADINAVRRYGPVTLIQNMLDRVHNTQGTVFVSGVTGQSLSDNTDITENCPAGGRFVFWATLKTLLTLQQGTGLVL